MAITGTYTDNQTGVITQNAYAKIFPIETQSIQNPVSGALPYARYTVNVWPSQSAMDSGMSPIASHQYVTEGNEFLVAFAEGAEINHALQVAATNATERQIALEAGILAPTQANAITRAEFLNWSII